MEDKEKGFERLPDGVFETQRVTVVRSNEPPKPPTNISNVHLPGRLNITKLKYQENGTMKSAADGISVDSRMKLLGNCSEEVVDQIWILVGPANLRWYPQSDNNRYSVKHVDNSHRYGTSWIGPAYFNGSNGAPFDVVVVLANASADRWLDKFQKRCGETPSPDHPSYPGLLTTELPPGIDEMARLRVILNHQGG